MPPEEYSNQFDAYYYAHGCGKPYERNEEWLGFFGAIADQIVRLIQPKTVLDAGCAMGFLVEALRQRGVEAYGVDISEYAIQNAHSSIQPYCWRGSVAQPFPQKYDLIVSIEVLEHMPRREAEQAIQNICQHTDDVLFSSTPFDFKEISHFNVQPPEKWAELFAMQDFFRDVDFDASFITQWAVRFHRDGRRLPRILSDYERKFFQLWKETTDLRQLSLETRNALAASDARLVEIQSELTKKSEEFQAARSQWEKQINVRLAEQAQAFQDRLSQVERKYEAQLAEEEDHHLNQLAQQQVTGQAELAKRDAQINRLNEQIQALQTRQREKDSQVQSLRGALDEILTSRPWRTMQALQGIRLRFIPRASRREEAYHLVLRGLGYLRNNGLRATLSRLRHEIIQRQRVSRLRKRRKHPPSGLDFPIAAATPPVLIPPPHQASVDIVVCVHNALEHVRNCLESVIRYTTQPYRLILIDDGSDAPTRDYLSEFAESQDAMLLRSEHATGYTLAANRGLHASNADYTVLLNSDTIVTPQWLDRMLACGESDPQIGIVGPLSNTASWQSVPEIFNETGDWADNRLPEGVSVADMARLVARNSSQSYPRLPFLNGFCLEIKRDLIEQIGYFDEQNFGKGYGEENDYSLRAQKAGRTLAVADDAYIFHAHSRSYSNERRKPLAERADKALVEKHGQPIISEGVSACRNDRVLMGNRERIQELPTRQQWLESGRQRWEGKRVAFLLPVSEPGGGSHVVIQEAEAMQRMGVDARVINMSAHKSSFEAGYPELKVPVVYIEEPSQARAHFSRYDAVVATVYHSTAWLDDDGRSGSQPVRGYYIQDFEPDFFTPGSPEHKLACQSYERFPDLVRITKTAWNRDIVIEKIGVGSTITGPSIDIDLFRPIRRKEPAWPARPLRVTAMIRPSTPRRQPELTMHVLHELILAQREKVEIILFGCQPDDPAFTRIAQNYHKGKKTSWRHAGVLTRPEMVTLFNECDIFVDFSSFQAMGLTALEAMACGAAVVVPERGGSSSFCRHEENALITDTASEAACLESLERLIQDQALRSKLQQQAIVDVCHYAPEQAAYKILEALFPGGNLD